MTLREQLTQKTQISKTLAQMLTNLWDDDDFIIGVLGVLKSDEQKQKMIDILEDGEDDTDQITLLTLDIADGEI